MGRPGPKTTPRYGERFKATAVRLSELRGVRVQDVAESLYIHPFMLSRWRKQVREGVIVSRWSCPRQTGQATGWTELRMNSRGDFKRSDLCGWISL